jgi:hypothetical protein
VDEGVASVLLAAAQVCPAMQASDVGLLLGIDASTLGCCHTMTPLAARHSVWTGLHCNALHEGGAEMLDPAACRWVSGQGQQCWGP